MASSTLYRRFARSIKAFKVYLRLLISFFYILCFSLLDVFKLERHKPQWKFTIFETIDGYVR